MSEVYALECEVCKEEHTSTIRGFNAARLGREKIIPAEDSYAIGCEECWEHGYACFNEGLLPYGLQTRIYGDLSLDKNAQSAQKASDQFREKRALTPEIEKILKQVIYS